MIDKEKSDGIMRVIDLLGCIPLLKFSSDCARESMENKERRQLDVLRGRIERVFPVADPEACNYSDSPAQRMIDNINREKSLPPETIPGEDGPELADSEEDRLAYLDILHATAIVFMWSTVETILRETLPYMCVLEKPGAKLDDKEMLFDQEFRDGQGRYNFRMDKFEDYYKQTIGPFNGIRNCEQIKDILGLNNMFKHCDSIYDEEAIHKKGGRCLSGNIKNELWPKPSQEYIKWRRYLKKERGLSFKKEQQLNIPYRNLDIANQMRYCNEFANDILGKIEQKLQAHNLIACR